MKKSLVCRSLTPHNLLLMALFWAVGCGGVSKKIVTHEIFADDGEKLAADGPVTFVVVGNLGVDPTLEKLSASELLRGAPSAVRADISEQIDLQRIAFTVLMGDVVASGGGAGWERFAEQFKDLLAGESLATDERQRLPAVIVPGDHEIRGDRDLERMGVAFPGTGANIGYNRVAGWSAFDFAIGESAWRLVFLDSNRDAMQARWDEQMRWIEEATAGDAYDHVMVFMHHPAMSLAQGVSVDPDGDAKELIDAVEESAAVNSLRAVFAADPRTSEVQLIGGPFGALHVGAGGGGAGAHSLARWAAGGEGAKSDRRLEAIYDMSILNVFREAAEAKEFPDRVLDQALGEGEYEGFPGVYDAGSFPLVGYWRVTLDDDAASVVFRVRRVDGSLGDVYRADFTEDAGWRTGQ